MHACVRPRFLCPRSRGRLRGDPAGHQQQHRQPPLPVGVRQQRRLHVDHPGRARGHHRPGLHRLPAGGGLRLPGDQRDGGALHLVSARGGAGRGACPTRRGVMGRPWGCCFFAAPCWPRKGHGCSLRLTSEFLSSVCAGSWGWGALRPPRVAVGLPVPRFWTLTKPPETAEQGKCWA